MRMLLVLMLVMLSNVAVAEHEPSHVDTLLMARSHQSFETAMSALQSSIQEHGYSVAHVQKCDGGMAQFGYHSDFYRVVFFGKVEEVRQLSATYPQLIPFLPLKILVFAENDKTVFTALNPDILAKSFPSEPELQAQLRAWRKDLGTIMAELDSDG